MNIDQCMAPTTTPSSSAGNDGKTKLLTLRCRKAMQSQWLSVVLKESKCSHDRFLNYHCSGLLGEIRSPEADRLQLRAQSCNAWFPSDMGSGLDKAMEFTSSSAARSPALVVALDASSLIAVGQEDCNIRMLLAGQALYGEALTLLRMEMTGQLGKQAAPLLAAINVLQTTETYLAMGSEISNRRLHTKGTAYLLQDIHAAQLANTRFSGLSQLLEANFVLYHFWDVLLARKHVGSFFRNNATALYKIAQGVPGMLQACDHAFKAGTRLTTEMADHLMKILRSIESDLTAWSTSWNRCIREAPYQLVSSTTFPFPERGASKPNKAFPLVFQFNNLTNVLDHTIFSACLLSIKRALLDISTAISSSQFSAQRNPVCENGPALVQAVTNCADTLCMGLPYLCDSRHGKFGLIVAAGPLCLASNWYHHKRPDIHQIFVKQSWCYEGSRCLIAEGVRPI